MEINQNVKLHNRWDVEVRDAKTGELKQKAVGFNVITNTYFMMKLKLDQNTGPTTAINHIAVGTGSGTPAITDTGLFTPVLYRESTLVQEVYAYPTSYIVRQIVINADEYNDQTFTEVGMCYYYMRSSGGPLIKMCTHAMLQDSEGNPIAIEKTDVDVVYIRATFYCSFSQAGWGNNGTYPLPAKNTLVQWLLKGTDSVIVRTNRFTLANSSDLDTDYDFTKTYYISNGTGNIATMRYTLPEITILDSEWNPHTVGCIGIVGFGAFNFPDASAFPDYQVTRLPLGDGDGATTEYNIGCPLIKTGSVHIFVGDLEKTEGTDYTVDLESNCNDARENYWSAGMNCEMETVSFGDLATRSPHASSEYRDPLYWGGYKAGQRVYAQSCTVNAANPIWLDFSTAKECNALRIDGYTSWSSNLDNLVIEYSNDNSSWTAVSATRTITGTVGSYSYYKWTWTPVTARYWRCYISNYNWTYNLSLYNDSIGTRDGTTHIKSTFFLGKSKPGLVFTTPPALGQTVEASYLLDVPYKTQNNLMRIAVTVQLQRG